MRTWWSWLAVFLVGLVVASLVVSVQLTAVNVDVEPRPWPAGEPRVDTPTLPTLVPNAAVFDREPRVDTPTLPTLVPNAAVFDREPQAARPRIAWADIPLDTEGDSLGDQFSSFNQAFRDVAVSDVKTCLAGTRRDASLLVTVALSIEGTASGYDVLDAQVLDGQLDADRKRCLELAMAGQIDVPGRVGEPGQRYRLEFPILVTAAR